jgi:hypothetical protein
MIERRKTPRKDWVIGKDEVGRSVLEWTVDRRSTERNESDPLARTYNFLKRLETPELALEEDAGCDDSGGRNPYDTGVYRVKRSD